MSYAPSAHWNQFFVNSTEDALIRAERHPPIREIEPNYFVEHHAIRFG
ncbi:hypothetical protein LC593_01630 [Nostoc sp. CHAB 5844]|nr:hypothetical protein [Nostoc sp. CHAB 5844]